MIYRQNCTVLSSRNFNSIKMKPRKINKNKHVSKNQWLAKALDTLESEGVEGVKIERLAKQLGISRSGFYWHFKNRQDMLQHLLDYWAREYTGVVTDNEDMKKLDPERRLLINIKMVRDKKLAKYDLAMHAWAKIDPLAYEVVKKVIKMRLDFNRAIFAELGFDGDELEMRTRLFVCYHSWEVTMFIDDNDDKNLRLQQLRHKMFIK